MNTNEPTYEELLKIFEVTPIAIGIVKESKITFANQKLLDILEYKKDELIGISTNVLFDSKEDKEKLRKAKYSTLEKEKKVRIETRYKTKNGTILDVVMNSSYLNGKDMSDGVITTIEDITEQKKAEQLLLEKEKSFKALIENEPAVVTLVDKEHKFKYVSPSIRTLGYTEEEFLKLTPLELTHSEDFPIVFNAILEVMQDETKVLTLSYRFKKKNNEWFWIESTFSNKLNEPNIEAVVINSRDINDKKIAEDKLQKNQEKYRFLIENILDVVWILDVETLKIIFISPSVEKLNGYTVEESLRQELDVMFTPESLKEVKKELELQLAKFIESGKKEIYRYEFQQIHKNGTTIWVEMITYFRVNPDNNRLEVIGTTRNINERKLAEIKLKESEEKFSKIFNSSPDMLILTRLSDAKILEVNESFLSLTKHNLEEVIGKNTLEIKLWAEYNNRTEYIRLLNENGFVRNIEYDFLLRSGELRNGLVSANIININNEACILGTVRDITERNQTEKALKESEELYSAIVNQANYSISLVDDETGHFLKFNKSAYTNLGYTKEEFEKLHVLDLDAGLSPQELETMHDLKSPNGLVFETKHRCKNGQIRNVRVSSKFFTLGNKGYFATIWSDITEEKKIQNKLNDERIMLKTLIESIPDYIFLKDLNGVYLACNKKTESFFGAKEEDIIGKSDFDFVSQEDAKDFRLQDQKVLESNQALTTLEWITYKSDGHKELLQTIKTPVYDSLGTLIGLLGIGRNITSLHKAQEEVKEREEIYSTIISQANDSILLIDSETGSFFEFNEASFNSLGYTKEEFGKMKIFDIDKSVDNEKIKSTLLGLENSKSVVFETKHNAKNGEIKNVKVSIKSLKIKEKIYFAAIWTDITEIKQMNENLEKKVKERTEQLETANKDLESFAYSVSHDLRAPLRHIEGFSRLLKNNLKESSEDIEKYFDKITASANKMSKMIDDLLKFSRLGRKVLEKTKVNLNVLVNQVIESFKLDLIDRKVEFKVGVLPIVQGDYGLLLIAFENLISNAIKFTSKKEQAIIEIFQCENSNKEYNIYIRDNGVGFDMAYADKLFGVFQRLHTESEFSGTGIGLANIKQIIQKHGGTIHAEGKVDKGATFFLTLK